MNLPRSVRYGKHEKKQALSWDVCVLSPLQTIFGKILGRITLLSASSPIGNPEKRVSRNRTNSNDGNCSLGTPSRSRSFYPLEILLRMGIILSLYDKGDNHSDNRAGWNRLWFRDEDVVVTKKPLL